MEKKYYTYIVKCQDGTFYTGFTTDLKKRIKTHNSGKGAKYTRSRLPVELIYHETFLNQHDAMTREYAIKKLSRHNKETLLGWEKDE
ncbi:MAG: GIY-YIG nuclease family protein [Eubacteriaceae bacterium]|nr:GIY-YIG nuclease family protein [Eubacteriaceae bacterium]